MHPRRDLALSEVDEHLHRGEQESRRVRDVLPGDVGRGTVDRLEHRGRRTDVRGTDETDRARDLRGDVGDDVPVEVQGQDDVEVPRSVSDQRRADVDDAVLVLDVGVLGGDLLGDTTEQSVGQLHDVVLREDGDLPPTVGTRVLERVAGDALAARPGDELQALHDLVGLAVLDAAVEVLLVLADDDDVHARVTRRDERCVARAGPHVREESQRLPDGDVQALHPSALRRRDRCLEQHPGPADRVEVLSCDATRDPARVDRGTDLDLVDVEMRSGSIEHCERRVHDLGTDPIATRDDDRGGAGGVCGGSEGHGELPWGREQR